MPAYSLNCEGFTVEIGNQPEPQIKCGLPLVKVRWGGEDDPDSEQRYYVDLALEAKDDIEDSLRLSDHYLAALSMAVDIKDPPALDGEYVRDFSMTAELLRNPYHKGNFDVPERLHAKVANPVGRAALVRVVDFSPYSYQVGNADIREPGRSILMAEYRASSEGADIRAGVSAILMPHNSSIVIRRPSSDEYSQADFDLLYNADHADGLRVVPHRRFFGRPPRGTTTGHDPENPEGGGSDREPRRPITPFQSGEAAAEIPIETEFQEIGPYKIPRLEE